MLFGASMFFTDYSMHPGELALALEERGFESSGRRSTRTSQCRGNRASRRAATCRNSITT